MALPQYQTLGELRLELAERTGWDGDPEGANAAKLGRLLARAQRAVWEQLDFWTRAIRDFTFETEADRWQYPWPEQCDPDRVQYVYLRWQENQVNALAEGFGVEQYNLRDTYRSWPARYRRREQIEFFPTPDDAYEVIVGAQLRLAPFAVDTDRATVPDDMVLLQAQVYEQTDQGRLPAAAAAEQALNARIRQLRGRSHTGPYLPGRPGGASLASPGATWPRPIIGT